MVDGNHITRSKPDPEVFLRAAQLLELPPEDCAGVDDAWRVESARTAGMTAAAIGPAALAGAGDWNLECLSRLLDLCPASGRGTGPVIRLIACDIDGTLLRGTQREISPAVFREVVRLGKQGVRFCPASGRQYHSLRAAVRPHSFPAVLCV